MKFSVIIPVHNAECTLERCVLSVVRQPNCDLEILLIENASDDNSFPECKRLQSEFENVKCFRSDVKGISHARNLGLQHAGGDVICFCDADDYYDEDVLEKIEKLFRQTEADMIITGYQLVDGSSDEIKTMPADVSFAPDELMGRVLNDGRIFGSVWNKFYRKDIIGSIRFCEDLSLGEDMHFNMQVLSGNPNIKCWCSKLCTYHYIYNETSSAHSNDYWNWQNAFEGNKLKYIIANNRVLDDCKLSDYVRREVYYSTIGHAINYLHNYGNEMDVVKKQELKAELKKHLFSFLMVMGKYHRRFNLTRLGWIMRELR